jgi:hypothetical protein
MSTVAEIEAAIKALPSAERERLAKNLPSILPELNGDLKWQHIVNDPAPRPALTVLGDEIATQFKKLNSLEQLALVKLAVDISI